VVAPFASHWDRAAGRDSSVMPVARTVVERERRLDISTVWEPEMLDADVNQ
jgi:hypothetical protein